MRNCVKKLSRGLTFINFYLKKSSSSGIKKDKSMKINFNNNSLQIKPNPKGGPILMWADF